VSELDYQESQNLFTPSSVANDKIAGSILSHKRRSPLNSKLNVLGAEHSNRVFTDDLRRSMERLDKVISYGNNGNSTNHRKDRGGVLSEVVQKVIGSRSPIKKKIKDTEELNSPKKPLNHSSLKFDRNSDSIKSNNIVSS
jgi:hypothetical protein